MKAYGLLGIVKCGRVEEELRRFWDYGRRKNSKGEMQITSHRRKNTLRLIGTTLTKKSGTLKVFT